MGDQIDFGRLGSLIGTYRWLGEQARDGGAPLAGACMLGAAVEGALLALAVLEEDRIRERGLWPKRRPGPEYLTMAELCDIGVELGWLDPAPGVDGHVFEAAVQAVRDHRRLLHPGRVVRDALPFDAMDGWNYDSARSVLDAVLDRLALATRRHAGAA